MRDLVKRAGRRGHRPISAAFSPERGRGVVVLSNTARGVDRQGWRLLDES